MYLGLALFPWMLMYALSTLVMNHRALFTAKYGSGPVPFLVERELSYDRAFPEPADLETISSQILASMASKVPTASRAGRTASSSSIGTT